MMLSLQTANWNPSSAADYVSLTWNYNGQDISPGQAVAVTLSLSVSSSIQGITASSFEIIVAAAE